MQLRFSVMIQLTRLGGEPFILNAELIQYVEARPDTFITLTTGERLVVAEAMDEVLRRAMVYQQAKHLVPPPVMRKYQRSGRSAELRMGPTARPKECHKNESVRPREAREGCSFPRHLPKDNLD